MGKIYKGQTDLTIKLDTDKNLTGITDVSIITKNPKGVMRTFIAEVDNAASGIIKYIIQDVTDFDVTGNWILWAKVVDLSGLISIGEPSNIRINNQGE